MPSTSPSKIDQDIQRISQCDIFGSQNPMWKYLNTKAGREAEIFESIKIFMEITKVDIQFNDNKYLHCYEYEKLWENLTSFSVEKKKTL